MSPAVSADAATFPRRHEGLADTGAIGPPSIADGNT